MRVVEIFDSIQGEGCWMGAYVTFIRLPGCNLKCPFCDEHSKYDNATDIAVSTILRNVNQHIVVITGGEPTINGELGYLIHCLKEAGHQVHIETNGTNPLPMVKPDWVTVSPKRESGFKCVPEPNELKFVVDEDLKWIEVRQVHDMYPDAIVWLQPCDGPSIEESKAKIGQWMETWGSLRWVRAGIQLHKYYEVR